MVARLQLPEQSERSFRGLAEFRRRIAESGHERAFEGDQKLEFLLFAFAGGGHVAAKSEGAPQLRGRLGIRIALMSRVRRDPVVVDRFLGQIA